MPRLRQAKQEDQEEQSDLINKIDKTDQLTESSSSAEAQTLEAEPVEEAQQQEDASVALQKQLDELRKSEKIQRDRALQAEKDRSEAIQRAREREVEVAKFQREALQSQTEAISSSLAAANTAAEKAQQDIENAVAIGDTKSQAEAYRRLARAEADIARLEDGKVAIEAKAKEEPRQQQSGDHLDNTNLPESAKTWLRQHPEYITNPRLNSRIQALHWDVLEEGHAAFSPEYFESMETKLGMRQSSSSESNNNGNQQEQPRKNGQSGEIVSAPVSREAPSGGGTRSSSQVKLTPQQREAAKLAGITETEYAKQLVRFNEAKSKGEIQ